MSTFRLTTLLVLLFSMFCYTTELERLGKELMEPSGGPEASRG